MYQRLFKKPHVIKYYCDAPMASERERYLLCAEELGSRKSTLQRIARALLVAVKYFPAPPSEITSEDLRRVVKQSLSKKSRVIQSRFLLHATKWYQFLGCWREPIVNQPFAELVADFSRFLQVEKGLSPRSIETYSRYTIQFLQWYWPLKSSLTAVRIEDVDTFLSSKTNRWSRVTISICVDALRAFFQHAARRAWCTKDIVEGIDKPRIYGHENIPLGPAWEDVGRLLAALDTEEPRDIRDRVIVMLAAIYGLRSSEIVQLRLDDIDWGQNQILIWRPKQRQRQVYPLVPTLGNAIIGYLRNVRPKSARRELFLTLRAPFRPISTGALGSAVRARFITLDIRSHKNGPHSLRHACATHLLERGLTVKEVGDHLGHRSSEATRVYAKTDMTALREVAILPFGFGGEYET